MTKRILITGASGLIGSRLTEILLHQGHEVAHLGRHQRQGRVPSYVWDVAKGTMDPRALESVEAIVHLAGAGIADKRWTAARKKEIIDSRTQSIALLYDALNQKQYPVTCFVSASAVGYYGPGRDDQVFSEESPAGGDFLATVTKQWEAASNRIGALGIRGVKLRTGIVLSEKGGVLKSMAAPVKLGFGAPLGTGKQYLSWIHLDDLCAMYSKAINDPDMKGIYNATGTEPVTQRELTKAIAKTLNKPLWLPSVPAFALKLALGEMADLVLTGSKVSSEKIRKAGFAFQFNELEQALKNLFS
jgi:uncharacterized protein